MPSHKIVIVEDDSDLLEALTREFKAAQFEVFAAHNGREGISRVLQVRPDLIILDILMPEITGHQMMQELVEHHGWVCDLPVLVITNYGSGEEIAAAWMKDLTVACLIKSESSLEDIVAQAKSLLHSPSIEV